MILNTNDVYLIVMDPGSPNMEVCYGVLMPNGPDSDISNWIASTLRQISLDVITFSLL